MQGIVDIGQSDCVIHATGSHRSHKFKEARVIETASPKVVESECHLELVCVIEAVSIPWTEFTQQRQC